MANTEVPLLYNEYRLRAIKKVLEESGSSVEQVLKNRLDSVYRDIVPAEEQERIEEMIHREESASQQNNRAYGIYHLHGEDGDILGAQLVSDVLVCVFNVLQHVAHKSLCLLAVITGEDRLDVRHD